LTASARGILGEALVGVYPHGSLMLGGWRAERSDVDVLVVVDRPLTSAEKSRLADAWSAHSLPCPGVGLELSVVTRACAAAPTARPPFELHVTTASSDRKAVDGHGHPGDPDLVLHFAVCRSLGHEAFAHVPRRLVMARLADELTWAVDHAPPVYAVLNASRAWRYAVDGSLVSKVDGGRWAEERLSEPELGLVRAATACQSGEATDPVDPTAARSFTLRLRDVLRTEA
jgi:streptomycin 3"-adenylyltransferase